MSIKMQYVLWFCRQFTLDNKKIKKDAVIEPETIITARTNAFTYYFNQYAGIVTTIVSVISTTLTIQAYLKK